MLDQTLPENYAGTNSKIVRRSVRYHSSYRFCISGLICIVTTSSSINKRLTRHRPLTTRHLLRLLLLLLLPTLNLPLLLAQTTNATLNGQVTDTSGAAIPNAKVVAVNDATGVRYETKTNNDGIYVEPNLPPGIYHIEITKEGFKTVMQPGIELHVQDGRSANYTLQVGAQSETVTVQASSYMINTQDASVSTTIDRNFAENLPLNGRSFQTLILLTPGTTMTYSFNSNNGGQFSVNGQRANANSFTIDGVSANLGGYTDGVSMATLNGSNPSFTIAGTTQGMVSIDALQEFKIQTSTYAPEFGRQPGGQVLLLTRSGTNAFHGTAFNYFRNDALDANNWFNDSTVDPATGKTLPKGKERQNDFGGTFGGPILKDRTFFFFSYEGLRLLVPTAQVFPVPSIITRQQASPVFQSILNSFPLPDPNGSGGTYLLSVSPSTNLNNYDIKIDHAIRSSAHLFGKYSDLRSNSETIYGANVFGHPKLTARSLTLGADVAPRPDLNNELRLNYSVNTSRANYSLFSTGGAQPLQDSSIFFPSPLNASRDSSGIVFLAGGFFVIPVGSTSKISQRQINVVDNLTHPIGRHELKWGADYRRLFPILGNQPVGAVFEVLSASDLTNGKLTQAVVNSSLVAHPIYTNLSIYGQDTWKVADRLTLTYGLRWELNPAPGERDGIQPFNVIGINNPATATLAPLNSSLFKTTYNNFSPRFGLAYQLRRSPGHETVLRAGLGSFYDLNSEQTALGFNRAPFQNSIVSQEVPFPITAQLTIPTIPAPTTLPLQGGFPVAIAPNLKLPYTLQWNVSLEQELGPQQSVTGSYVASAGYRLLRADELFGLNSNFPVAQAFRNASSSNYQSLQVQFNRRLSRGLQALLSYTYSHSIDNASDAETVLSTSTTGSNFADPNIDRGNSDFDLRHAFRAAVTYMIPSWNTNFLSKAILGGWSLEAIGIAQTSLPVNVIGGQYSLPNGGFAQLRPNVVPGVPLYLHGPQYPGGMAFNSTLVKGACPDGSDQIGAFCPVPVDVNGFPTQVEGTLGRNTVRGFGAWQTDFGIHRKFNLTERANLEFRCELFNIFNHPNFGSTDAFVPDGQGVFGLATATLNNTLGGLNSLYQIGGPRSTQLTLKLSF